MGTTPRRSLYPKRRRKFVSLRFFASDPGFLKQNAKTQRQIEVPVTLERMDLSMFVFFKHEETVTSVSVYKPLLLPVSSACLI